MQIVETIWTICQSLFSGKNKKLEDNLHEMLKRKKIINLSAVESAKRVIKVNLKLYMGRVMQKRVFEHMQTAKAQVNITKTCLYNSDPLKPHFYIVKLGFTGVYIIFLISAQNIDCG